MDNQIGFPIENIVLLFLYISVDLQESESDMDDDKNSEDLCSKRERPIRNQVSDTRAKLNDVVRNLGLAKYAAEYLASEIKHDGIPTKDTSSSYHRYRNKKFLLFFKKEDSLV